MEIISLAGRTTPSREVWTSWAKMAAAMTTAAVLSRFRMARMPLRALKRLKLMKSWEQVANVGSFRPSPESVATESLIIWTFLGLTTLPGNVVVTYK